LRRLLSIEQQEKTFSGQELDFSSNARISFDATFPVIGYTNTCFHPAATFSIFGTKKARLPSLWLSSGIDPPIPETAIISAMFWGIPTSRTKPTLREFDNVDFLTQIHRDGGVCLGCLFSQ
jgi:hypothetical protein